MCTGVATEGEPFTGCSAGIPHVGDKSVCVHTACRDVIMLQRVWVVVNTLSTERGNFGDIPN